MQYLVTGTAGFIGFHVAKRLLDDGHQVLGLDGFTPYYDVRLKESRHALLKQRNGFTEHRGMLEDADAVLNLGESYGIDAIIHLAAQAGVRYSLENPRAYVDANLIGTFNILELARTIKPKHLMLASTSSVYGSNTVMPFEEIHRTDFPLTLYAATKKATEGMSHSYAHLWKLPTTVFRFFSVYGPWGRPDMALFKFTKGIIEDEPIDVYNGGDMLRDFTYIDDLVEGIVRLADKPPTEGLAADESSSASNAAPWRVVNIGRGSPYKLMDFIHAIERSIGKSARLNLLPMQPGDVSATFANAAVLEDVTGYVPATTVEDGVAAFVAWYRDYYAPERVG